MCLAAMLQIAGCNDPAPVMLNLPESPITGAVMALSVDSTTLKPLQMTSIFKKDRRLFTARSGGQSFEENAVSAELVLVRSAAEKRR
jgi:hypothetical protein